MKKALVAIAALLVSLSAYAQGQVNFNTHVTSDTPAVDARIFNIDGVTPATTGFGELFILKSDGTLIPMLDQNGTGAFAFRTTTAGAGYINGGGVGAAGSPAGTYNLVLQAWQGGTTFANATIARGQSAPVSVQLTEAPALPNDLIGLQGFKLTAVPEPTTLALGAIGLGALLIRRRK